MISEHLTLLVLQEGNSSSREVRSIERKPVEIDGVHVFTGKEFKDLRGALIKPYSRSFMPSDLNSDFKEVWFTKSHRNVIRGMHMQIRPYGCEKLVSVIHGAVEDVLLDLRRDSRTFGSFFSIILCDDEPQSLFIPYGCAHGYKVISEMSIVMYMGTEVNVPSCDVGIRWDSFGYDWKVSNPILSDRDKKLQPMSEININI